MTFLLTFNYKFKSFENIFFVSLSGASLSASEDQNLNNIYDDLLELSYNEIATSDKQQVEVATDNKNVLDVNRSKIR